MFKSAFPFPFSLLSDLLAAAISLPNSMAILFALIGNVYPSGINTSSATQAPGLGVGSACTLTNMTFHPE